MNQSDKKLVVGILAHVDAGKTTLSEAMLYQCGQIRSLGRVDHQDAYLDNSPLERERGITIFSKQARMTYKDTCITLLDTPGHVDFSAEMERTLQVLDYAILVISGTDGVQAHTQTVWRLLERYRIPVFIFVNKMDLPDVDNEKVMRNLREKLSVQCVDFTDTTSVECVENIALCDDELMEHFLETDSIELPQAAISLVKERKLFPCCFGSALKMKGIEHFLNTVVQYTEADQYGTQFGAKVYKITRDEQDNRLTHMKITGGGLHIKDVIYADQKVNGIRLYSGERFDAVNEAAAGDICTVQGLNDTYPGQGLGFESDFMDGFLEPVLNYSIEFQEDVDAALAYKSIRQIEEEDPKLHIMWDEMQHKIFVQPMGEVQLEVLQQMIEQRYGWKVTFGEGRIIYRETIGGFVEGVGHFEPLRHYAEVHLLMEPLKRGTGLVFEADCSEDKLDLNWQRLILTHLQEREFPGVLTGSMITDIKFTLVAGKAHIKHTEGGDFRQATYRAVRQGLMQAESILLEPYYHFEICIPTENVGRAMSDITCMHGGFEVLPYNENETILTGRCPVASMKDYAVEIASYTKGLGRISYDVDGYDVCHNTDEVVENIGYEWERDLDNTPHSVFCSHGAGVVVKWDEVKSKMHVQSPFSHVITKREQGEIAKVSAPAKQKDSFSQEKELQQIFERTFGPVRQRTAYEGTRTVKGVNEKETVFIREFEKKEEYLLVDGYNIIFAWDELNELSKINLESARTKLMDILCNYQGYTKCNLILVFDAYKVKGNPGSVEQYHNISVVYTKEAETADMYIEKTTKKMAKNHKVRVATSDGMEQMIILGHGASRLSARIFKEEVEQVEGQIKEQIEQL